MTVAPPAPPLPRSRARSLPVPECEPPYEDHAPRPLPPGASTNQLSLDLAHTLPSGLPAEPELRVPVRVVGIPPVPENPATWLDPDHGVSPRAERRRPTAGAELPEPSRWSARLGQAVMECLAGDRPVQQLSRWADEPVFRALARRATLRSRQRAPRRQPPVLVRSVRTTAVSPTAVEACVVVQTGPRARALALRLEGLDGRWMCTALDVI